MSQWVHLVMPSRKWRPFHSGLKELTRSWLELKYTFKVTFKHGWFHNTDIYPHLIIYTLILILCNWTGKMYFFRVFLFKASTFNFIHTMHLTQYAKKSTPRGPLCKHVYFNFNPSMDKQWHPLKLWNETTYSFPNFNHATVDDWEWKKDFLS